MAELASSSICGMLLMFSMASGSVALVLTKPCRVQAGTSNTSPGADAHFIGIAQGQRAAAGLNDEQVPPGMNVAVQHRAGFQPLHGHRHAWRQLATFDSSFMGQRDNIDFAGLETLAHACKFGRLPYPSTEPAADANSGESLYMKKTHLERYSSASSNLLGRLE